MTLRTVRVEGQLVEVGSREETRAKLGSLDERLLRLELQVSNMLQLGIKLAGGHVCPMDARCDVCHAIARAEELRR